jgi:hypothetical protein
MRFCFGIIITSQTDFANTIVSFRILNGDAEAFPLNSSLRFFEVYNVQFSTDELLPALECRSNTSHGPNGIHVQMLTYLPPAGKEFLLSV